MSHSLIRIATRKSPLALWQANYVREALLAHHIDLQVELVPLSTRGDQILDTPLAKVGGKGLFVKELERALLAGEADIAVHSMKDVPMEFPTGLALEVICDREDPTDALVSNKFSSLGALPTGAKVGTSSFRRQCQLKALRPDLTLLDLRGNVGTRLRKLDQGDYDAIILASAGLLRLELVERIAERLDPMQCLPAGGQGAVGIECRSDDEQIKEFIAPLHHQGTAARVIAERAVVARLQGGCQLPIASFSVLQSAQLHLSALVGDVASGRIIRSEVRGTMEEAEQLGTRLADDLLSMGADAILANLQQEQSAGERD